MSPLTICLGLAIFLIGCQNSKQSLYEEIDHETPAHWPTDMLDAADKIRSRMQVLASQSDNSEAQSELVDLVNWCAEIAADTDLTEKQWEPIYVQSELCRKQVEAGVAISSLTNDLNSLCSTLEAAHHGLPPKPTQ